MTTNDNAANKSSIVFKNLSLRYFIGLSILAVIIIISQWLIQNYLEKQINDSRVINVAGRQRMLSQKLAKEVLQLTTQKSTEQLQDQQQTIQQTLNLWTSSHQGLKNGSTELALPGNNSEIVEGMFDSIEVYYQEIVTGSTEILTLLEQPIVDKIKLDSATAKILSNEANFLSGMDKLVFQYDFEAKQKVVELSGVELFLLLVALLAIILELFFIFRPTASYVKNIIQQLTEAEAAAQQQRVEITELYQTKERSLQELRALNFAVDQTALFASITLDGSLIYISKKLANFLGYKDKKPTGQLEEILTSDEGQQQYIAQIIRTPRSSIWTGEISITNQNKINWLELSIVPVNRSNVKQDYLILCSNITTRKQTQLELERLNQEKFEEEIQLQKNRSLQIIKAQEEERKRIARDIHDGIGQMLTALKFNLEAISPKTQPIEKVQQKIDLLKTLSSNLIKGVRIATFNLTPPELTDYGISMALAKLCRELSKLTTENILFNNRSDFHDRLDSMVETNIYRITQEAVNNAIKYAKSPYILVTISHSNNLLSIMIDDNGIGIAPDELEKKEVSDFGTNKGLSFMKERVSFINGRLFVRSVEGEGTRITINLPIT